MNQSRTTRLSQLKSSSQTKTSLCYVPESGFGLCSCSTETFINFSSRTNRETAALLSNGWLCCSYLYQHLKDRYSFITVSSHGGYDYQCPSWIKALEHTMVKRLGLITV